MSTVPPLLSGKSLSGEGNLLYGALHPFSLPGWGSPEVIRVAAENWQVIFSLDKAGYINPERGGTITKRDLDGPLVFIAAKQENSDPAEALGVTPGQLHEWGSRWNEFDPFSVSRETGFALRWLYRGMIDFLNELDDRIDAFASLWLCTITLIRAWYAASAGGDLSVPE